MSVQVKNNLRQINSRLEKALSEVVRQTAFSIEARAKSLAPVDTGILRNSIQTKIESPTKATVGTVVEYAPHQEFGTRFQKGKPFMTPAVDAEKKEFEKRVQNLERSLR